MVKENLSWKAKFKFSLNRKLDFALVSNYANYCNLNSYQHSGIPLLYAQFSTSQAWFATKPYNFTKWSDDAAWRQLVFHLQLMQLLCLGVAWSQFRSGQPLKPAWDSTTLHWVHPINANMLALSDRRNVSHPQGKRPIRQQASSSLRQLPEKSIHVWYPWNFFWGHLKTNNLIQSLHGFG